MPGIAILPCPYYDGFVKTLTVKLPDPLFAEIEGAARARKVTKSEIARERLEQAKSPKRSLWSRMEDLVIHDESLPTDLATNKEHMRDYGKNSSDR